MVGAAGEKPSDALINNQFQMNFTPQFYPMRYALKDAMYSQVINI